MAEPAMTYEHGQPLPGHPGIRLVRNDEPNTHTVQAAAEDVQSGDYVEFLGETFRLADKVGMMPMIAFANASNKGLDSDDMAGLAAMYALIRSVIHRPPLVDEHGNRQRDESGALLRDETEWRRFERHADDEGANGEEIMDFVGKAMEIMAARPTARREVSSATSPQTSPTSKPVSSSPATIPGMDGLVPVARLGS